MTPRSGPDPDRAFSLSKLFPLFWRQAGSTTPRDGRAALGRRGERAAARYLRHAGYRILGRNLRLKSAEVDLLALTPDRGTIVVVEVKSSVGSGCDRFAPELNLRPAQIQRLRAAARELRTRNRWSRQAMRLDLVAVEWKGEQPWTKPEIRHHQAIG